MNNLQRVRDRIRKVNNSTTNYDVQSICRELEDLLFEDFTGGTRETKIELIAAYLGRLGLS